MFDGKLLSLRSGPQLQLKSLAKLRLLRIDDLAEPGDDKRWLHPAGLSPKELEPRISPRPERREVLATLPPSVSVSSDAVPQLIDLEADTVPPALRPTFRWLPLPPPIGSLAEVPAAQLVGWAIATGYTGCLWLSPETDQARRDAPARELFFDAGVLTFARSQLLGDGLVDVQGHLWTAAQRKRAYELLRKSRGDGLRKQLELLVTSRLLDAKDFPQRQADYVVELVCRAMVPMPGTFRLLGVDLPPGEQTMLPLQSRLLLLHAVRKGSPLDVLFRAVGPLSTVLVPTRLALPQLGGAVLQGIGLSQAEEDALLALDGDHSLQDIVSSSGIGEYALLGLAYCLLLLGALAHLHNLSPEEQKRLLLLRQARARSKAQSEAMAAIQRKARLCENADYFSLLGISPGASLDEVSAAYARERAAIAKTTLLSRSRSAMERELRQIALVLDEAHAILSDPVQRACYTPTVRPPKNA